MKYLNLLLLLLVPIYGFSQTSSIKISNDLELIPVSENIYIHKSFTNSEQFGRYSSNGLIYIQNGEVLIADTPVDTLITKQLMKWVEQQSLKIKAVIVNHHHSDALGGLELFHNRNIPSYGFIKTKKLALESDLPSPSNTFDDSLTVEIGDSFVKAIFFGGGHTEDNITLWLPEEKTLFGGCLVKSLRSGKGNLEDANVHEWPKTISKIKDYFYEISVVIPGHGSHGGVELLDFTQRMFEK
ncbi:MAG: subclass B1 metallo-beta-lactamase [Balneola sp.]